MDLVTDLPTSASGNNTIYTIGVFVDRLTKMVHFAPTTKTVIAPLMARIFVDTIYKHHGMPKTIISDRNPRFTSQFWRATWTLLRTTLKVSTTAHPQTDGQTERANRVLAEMLRSYFHPKQDDWEEYLPNAGVRLQRLYTAIKPALAVLLEVWKTPTQPHDGECTTWTHVCRPQLPTGPASCNGASQSQPARGAEGTSSVRQ